LAIRVGLGLIAAAGLLGAISALNHGPADPAAAMAPLPDGRPLHAPAVSVGRDETATADGESATAVPLRYVTATLGSGGTLARTLERAGLSPDERQRAVRAFATELDLSRLPVATGLCIATDEKGGVRGVSVRAEADRFVRWNAGVGESTVEVVELPVRTTVRHGAGRVVQSVRQALDEMPWANELTLAFADIFQWDIDLLVEPRTGDRVRVVYELETLDALPPDLPSFDRAASAPGESLRLGRVLAASYDGRVARSAAYWVDDPSGGGEYYDAAGAPLRKTFLKSPLTYRRISSRFSRARRHPVTRKVVPHHGVDFAAASGTPVVAAADGRVVSAGWEGALGRTVRIRHGSEYVTLYGHLRGFGRGIRAGVEVQQNQVVGFVGSSGRATGPHLHYTLIHRGRSIDPMTFRSPGARPLAPELRPHLERAKLTWAPWLDGDPLTVAGGDGPGGDLATLRRGI
jgi:murein DD-endopeptidase MepM/ murein hydrolase activator NlpD